jgi:cytochrome c556
MYRTLIASAALAVVTTAVLAQADLVASRKALMGENGKYMYRALPEMLKGAAPYDQAIVDAAFTQMAESAQKLPALFVASTKDVPPAGRFSISPKAWDNKADLDAKLANYAKVVAEERPKVKNLEALKESYAAVAKTCDSCHESYRVRN